RFNTRCGGPAGDTTGAASRICRKSQRDVCVMERPHGHCRSRGNQPAREPMGNRLYDVFGGKLLVRMVLGQNAAYLTGRSPGSAARLLLDGTLRLDSKFALRP